MKILYITNVRIPTEKAHGIQIIKMCEAFSNYNIKVELVLPTRKNIKFKDINLFKYYSIKENFKLKKIFKNYNFRIVESFWDLDDPYHYYFVLEKVYEI